MIGILSSTAPCVKSCAAEQNKHIIETGFRPKRWKPVLLFRFEARIPAQRMLAMAHIMPQTIRTTEEIP